MHVTIKCDVAVPRSVACEGLSFGLFMGVALFIPKGCAGVCIGGSAIIADETIKLLNIKY